MDSELIEHTSTGANMRLLSRSANAVERHILAALSDTDLSLDQWRVLEALYEFDGCTMSVLADAVGTSSATLTRVVDRLVTRSLVYRTSDAADRRRVLVRLAQRGIRQVDELRPSVDQAEDHLLAELSPSEKAQLTELLSRIFTHPGPTSA
ncbi:DNA-binding transcriptional regulator, MarR family [Brevibacterium siliguriense]|uniref:DNA-binding transcriptional regulator, MarR family n=1 Tax=Brevibacterium siliguriense TaxID=1136497 RepID=A0A1H1LJG0_9MICO|nr:MarR family transcriptional regulator [Brevibacterium siliguriense]SDR74721.1 DNA-binding transcriptional regulator, MarR family [Brevibacterium siliguriense]